MKGQKRAEGRKRLGKEEWENEEEEEERVFKVGGRRDEEKEGRIFGLVKGKKRLEERTAGERGREGVEIEVVKLGNREEGK